MLNIYFGEMEEAIYNPAVYFKNTYQDSWITNERSKAMIIKCLMHQHVAIIVHAGFLKMGMEKNITINLRHLMDFGEKEFTIHILNTDQIVHNMEELVVIAGMFVR